MPQMTLEYTQNIIEKSGIHDLLRKSHEVLVECLPTALSDCKSRVYECKDYWVGDGDPDNAFVHVCLKVQAGRTPEILRKTGDRLMQELRNYFSESLEKRKLQITIEIVELSQTYLKASSHS